MFEGLKFFLFFLFLLLIFIIYSLKIYRMFEGLKFFSLRKEIETCNEEFFFFVFRF